MGSGHRRPEGRILATVALGGALGAPARYGISLLVDITPGTFPWGTFWTNVSGAFLLGIALSLLRRVRGADPTLGSFLTTGFLGAYTTYSTFAVETVLLMKNGHVTVAMAYAGSSLAAG